MRSYGEQASELITLYYQRIMNLKHEHAVKIKAEPGSLISLAITSLLPIFLLKCEKYYAVYSLL